MRRSKYIAFLSMMLIATVAFAQKKNAQTAFNGLKGNYVYNLFAPASAMNPDKDSVASFRFERKAVNEANWQLLKNFSTPASFDDLKTNFEVAKNQVFDFKASESYRPEDVWPIFAKKFNYDSLQIFLSQQAMAAAFNILLIDTTARPNVDYQYRVTQVKTDGRIRGQYVTNTVNSNHKFQALRPIYRSRRATGELFTINWASKKGPLTQALLIMKNNGPHQKFEQKPLIYTIEERADSILYSIADNDVSPDELYQYVIYPVNRFGGGASVASDTASMSGLDLNLLVPQLFTARADSIKQTIVLNWAFFKPAYISAVKVYRSIDYDKNYLLVGTGANGVFIDQTALPGQKYYYYLQITDKLGREALKSVKVYGLYQTKKAPAAPMYVEAVKKDNQTLIKWQDFNLDTRGFYVYRSDQYEGKLLLISDFIASSPRDGGKFSFIDTAKTTGKVGYSVVAENLSNMRSGFSKPVYITTGNAPLQAPVLIDQLADAKSHRFFWQVPTGDNQPAGYAVYRKVNNNPYVKITRNVVRIDKTSFTDTTRLDGKITYKLVPVNADASESTTFTEIVFASKQRMFSPSSLKTFFNEDQSAIILEWQASQSAVSKYAVYRYTRGEDPTKIAELAGKLITYTDKSFFKNKTNYYYVVAVGENGVQSVPSNESFKMVPEPN